MQGGGVGQEEMNLQQSPNRGQGATEADRTEGWDNDPVGSDRNAPASAFSEAGAETHLRTGSVVVRRRGDRGCALHGGRNGCAGFRFRSFVRSSAVSRHPLPERRR